jgi:hypothetical protein
MAVMSDGLCAGSSVSIQSDLNNPNSAPPNVMGGKPIKHKDRGHVTGLVSDAQSVMF